MQICVNIWQKKENNLPANRYVLLDRTWKLTDFFLSSEVQKSITSRISSSYVSVYGSSSVDAISLAAGSKSTQCQLTQILGASLSKWTPCDILESNFRLSKVPMAFYCGWAFFLLFSLAVLEWTIFLRKGDLNYEVRAHGRTEQQSTWMNL